MRAGHAAVAAARSGISVADKQRFGGSDGKGLLQVRIPKKQPGSFRPLGFPTIRNRVARTSALLVLGPIFEADLPPEQYGHRPERGAHDALYRLNPTPLLATHLLARRPTQRPNCYNQPWPAWDLSPICEPMR